MPDKKLLELAGRIREGLGKVINGKDEAIGLLLTAVFADGHVLLEDVPGVGKTTLAKALALSIGGHFNRIQFTPDLLPSDILGCSIYNPREGLFHFRKGPVFTNILLADEINRASPRTQSALLEAMNESQVSIESTTYPLAKPFIVIATENPIEYYGTYPLPEAQLDRFAMELSLGYPGVEDETAMLVARRSVDPLSSIKPVMDCQELVAALEDVRKVDIEKSVAAYMVSAVRATREDPRIKLGASPRALLSLSRCAQAKAWLAGRDYVNPDDVKTLAPPVLGHRLALDNKVKHSGVKPQDLVREIISSLKPPA
jgi:MoxR-like ATPase